MSNAAVLEIPQREEELGGEGSGGKTGASHKGPEGMAGTPSSKHMEGAYALAGPTREQRLGSLRAAIESRNIGALGALASVLGANNTLIDPNSAFADSIGDAQVGYEGHIVGPHLGDAFGYNGLGMKGFGPGGNGFTDGLGVGLIPGFGYGPGDGGTNSGWCPEGKICTGSSVNHGKHRPGVGHANDLGTSDVTGGLPRETVRRIVRANFPYIRQCYEQGLKKDPELRGVVATRFIIDMTGAVETASLSSCSLSDPAVASCVVGVFRNMSFPSPENGKAMVTYPIDLQKD